MFFIRSALLGNTIPRCQPKSLKLRWKGKLFILSNVNTNKLTHKRKLSITKGKNQQVARISVELKLTFWQIFSFWSCKLNVKLMKIYTYLTLIFANYTEPIGLTLNQCLLFESHQPYKNWYRNKYEEEKKDKERKRYKIKCYLVHLGPNHLLAVVVLWHHHLHHLIRFCNLITIN